MTPNDAPTRFSVKASFSEPDSWSAVDLLSVHPVQVAGGNTSGGGGLGLGDIIVGSLEELLRLLFTPIEAVIERYGDSVLAVIVSTPHPDTVFSTPTNGAWPQLYSYYWDVVVPLSLTLFGLVLGLVIVLESTSYLFSNYHASKLKKRGFAGLLGLLSWWWIAALSLRFTDMLTRFLTPSVSNISFFETLSFTGMGVLGLVITLSADLFLLILIGLIYLLRHLILYLFVLLIPLLIVFWIPGVGPFTHVSRFMKKLAGYYVPFLFMTVPVALLFRVGDLLGQSAGFSPGGLGAWLTALVVPFAALLTPFFLFWQASLVFFIADRATHHISARRARHRVRGQYGGRRQGGGRYVRSGRGDSGFQGAGTHFESRGSTYNGGSGRLSGARSRLRSALSRDKGSDENLRSGMDNN